jgi:hypothetical protein
MIKTFTNYADLTFFVYFPTFNLCQYMLDKYLKCGSFYAKQSPVEKIASRVGMRSFFNTERQTNRQQKERKKVRKKEREKERKKEQLSS